MELNKQKLVTPLVAGAAIAGVTLAGVALTDKKNRQRVRKTLSTLQKKGKEVHDFAMHNVGALRKRTKGLEKLPSVKKGKSKLKAAVG